LYSFPQETAKKTLACDSMDVVQFQREDDQLKSLLDQQTNRNPPVIGSDVDGEDDG
jgi:hypothetical protein